MSFNSKKILFVDTVHPVLEERLLEQGYLCEQDLKSTKEEIESTEDGLTVQELPKTTDPLIQEQELQANVLRHPHRRRRLRVNPQGRHGRSILST